MRLDVTERILWATLMPGVFVFGWMLGGFRLPWWIVAAFCLPSLVSLAWVLLPQPRGPRGTMLPKTIGGYWLMLKHKLGGRP